MCVVCVLCVCVCVCVCVSECVCVRGGKVGGGEQVKRMCKVCIMPTRALHDGTSIQHIYSRHYYAN